MKIGTIIENEQGRFAKVLEQSGTRFGLSAWVVKKEQAELETVVVRFLNSFGLAQVMKEKPKAGKPAVQTATTPTPPSDGAVDYEAMTVPQLKDVAKDLGLTSTGNKAELIKLIAEHQEAGKEAK